MQPDSLGAFCTHVEVHLPGATSGPLAGLRFAAKDLFDIQGYATGAGHPDWLRTHAPARRTAPMVQRLLDAGASLIAKTQMAELAYSLDGSNIHYGTPINPRAPGRSPGGSSSGSAVAVAGGLVDFALGTDTGGSVRIPASFCGLFGIRPTHGRISLEGVVPLAPSFDTVGWFARDTVLFERVGHILLPEGESPPAPRRLFMAQDAFDLLDAETNAALAPALRAVFEILGPGEPVTLSSEGLKSWMHDFRILQGHEVWRVHGEWVRQTSPRFGPGIKERFEWVPTITDEDYKRATKTRARAIEHLNRLLDGSIVCLPSAPGIAPLNSTSGAALCPRATTRCRAATRRRAATEQFRDRALCLSSPAGLGGLPQLSLPLAELNGCPLGLSLLGGCNQDTLLLGIARAIAEITTGLTSA
jgi:Asp-tRNAAsn/Glu-tRNAGln amidotransferase A subunit and related amidases